MNEEESCWSDTSDVWTPACQAPTRTTEMVLEEISWEVQYSSLKMFPFFCHFILWKKGQLVLFPDPVICLCASGTPLVKITSRILPDVHYLLTSHERRWNVWLNKWVICVLGWWCVLFIIFFANPGSSNLQLFLFDPKWILFCLSLKATHLHVPTSSPYN